MPRKPSRYARRDIKTIQKLNAAAAEFEGKYARDLIDHVSAEKAIRNGVSPKIAMSFARHKRKKSLEQKGAKQYG